MFASLEAHFAAWAQTVGEEIAQHARAFLDHAKAEEERIAAEVAHLKAVGMQVLKDGVVL